MMERMGSYMTDTLRLFGNWCVSDDVAMVFVSCIVLVFIAALFRQIMSGR